MPRKKKKKNKIIKRNLYYSFWDFLKKNNISIFKFILYYLHLMHKAVYAFSYQYFRYFMLIIWRRNLIIWSSLLVYILFAEDLIKYCIDCIFNVIYIGHIWLIPFMFIFVLLLLFLLKKLYNFLFNYRDILDFNKEIKNYYSNEIDKWIFSVLSKQNNKELQNKIDNLKKNKTKKKKICLEK